jgi:hypothetical protein
VEKHHSQYRKASKNLDVFAVISLFRHALPLSISEWTMKHKYNSFIALQRPSAPFKYRGLIGKQPMHSFWFGVEEFWRFGLV